MTQFLGDFLATVLALRWVLALIVIVVTGALLADSNRKRRDLEDVVASLDQENEFIHRRLRVARHVDAEKVLDYINQRPEYVALAREAAHRAAERGTGPAAADDPLYHLYCGHAEARRRLAETLRLTVPVRAGDHATASTTYARVVNG